ncbi:probable acyl-CoA dehydrogenase 6 [Ptychodera flava]|uniref:probable acyl-CoA dehydrogenase 6 n=1 Tax=Ptychodera flava TaxID=63121 RepID=UPI003969F58F
MQSDVGTPGLHRHEDHGSQEGGDYVINGSKMWITNAIQSDLMCLLDNTGDEPLHLNESMICVALDTKGHIKSGQYKDISF